VKLNLKKILEVLKDIKDYLIPVKTITKKFKSINSIEQLKDFIQSRSAHVTQTTLYGYIKTRIGTRYAIMFEDQVFSKSINIAKWNIYMNALSDCTLYTFSYLIDKKNLNQNDSEKIFNSIIENEKKNGLDLELFQKTKSEFQQRIKEINWKNFHKEKPFRNSSLALYNSSPIAEELKILDKEIVLNSIQLKWNLVENEFKDLIKNLNFN
jgi:hypothetical protein